MNCRRKLALVVLTLTACAAPASAGTAAYWRHEEGVVGGFIPAGPDTVLDSSGNNNHMQTFDPSFTSATYTSAVSPLPLRSGQPNNLALDFGPGGDDAGNNDDNYTQGKDINIQLFNAMTIEMAFNMNAISGWQAVFGKDGKPLGDEPGEVDSPVPPLKFLIRNDDFPGGVPNQLFIEFIDGDGDVHFLSSGRTTAAGQWNHVAFTLTGTKAELWVAGQTGPYTLLDSITDDFAGAIDNEVLIFEPLGFSAGRGMFNNGVTDWADAKIDEIRISDVALAPDQFLFNAPSTSVPGDVNLNGVIDPDDFVAIDRGIAMGLTGYYNGDFNNDGVVNAGDYAVIDASFLAQSNAGAVAVAAVPEPASAAALGLVGLAALYRRRRG